VARLAAQARAAAVGAGLRVAQLGQLLAHHERIGLAVAALVVRDHAFERVLLDRGAAALGEIVKGDLLAPGAVQNELLDALLQRLPRALDVEAEMLGKRLEHRVVEVVSPVPAADRAARERQVRMRDDALRVEEFHRAEPVAMRAGAHRIVEGEKARLELGQRVVAQRAREARGEEVLASGVGFDHERAPVGVTQSGLEGLGQALARIGAHAQPIDDHVDRVLDVLGEARRGVEVVDLCVDAHAREALRAQLLQKIRLLALAPRDHGREDHEPAVLGQGGDLVDHLRDALRLQREMVLWAVRRAGARVEKPQIVVDLGHGADRRARVVARRLLLDRDRGRQALDQVHLGLRHELEELPRVRRERLDVAPLALGVQRVESERAFARTRKSRDHHEPVARQLEAEILQVVGAGSADPDAFHADVSKVKLATITRSTFPPPGFQ
jgi:hypothetical protein